VFSPDFRLKFAEILRIKDRKTPKRIFVSFILPRRFGFFFDAFFQDAPLSAGLRTFGRSFFLVAAASRFFVISAFLTAFVPGYRCGAVSEFH
jgi:hypothetical protein